MNRKIQFSFLAAISIFLFAGSIKSSAANDPSLVAYFPMELTGNGNQVNGEI